MNETAYQVSAPSPEQISLLRGLTLLEFGTDWCGHCRAAQQPIQQALSGSSARWQHLKVEDGPGRKLGRWFRVKLWPTLIVLQDGIEQARLVRPTQAAQITELLHQVESTGEIPAAR